MEEDAPLGGSDCLFDRFSQGTAFVDRGIVDGGVPDDDGQGDAIVPSLQHATSRGYELYPGITEKIVGLELDDAKSGAYNEPDRCPMPAGAAKSF